MKRIILVDDHPIFRTGLRQILEDEGTFEIVAEAGNVADCLSAASTLRPDFIITDLSMPDKDGYAVVEWVRENLEETRVIIISMHSHKDFVEKAMKCGAHGFIAKEDAGAELIDALQTQSSVFYASASAGRPVNLMKQDSIGGDITVLVDLLTATEKRVLMQIAQSRTSPQIADDLGVSARTIQTHRQNISRKLNLQGANSLMNFAIKNADAISRA